MSLRLNEYPLLNTTYGKEVLWARVVDARPQRFSAQAHDGCNVIATVERAPAWKRTDYVVRVFETVNDFTRPCVAETFHSTIELAMRKMERAAMAAVRAKEIAA